MGEEAAEQQVTEPEDHSVSSELDDPGFVPEDEEDKGKKPDKDKGKGAETPADETGDKPKDEDKKPEDEKPEEDPVATLKKEYDAKIQEKEKEISRLGYALRTAAKKPDKKEEEPTFTDAQLLAIMEQHKDDPKVMLQVFKEIVNVKGKEIGETAEKAADIKMKSAEFEKLVSTVYPETIKEGTQDHEAVEKAIGWLHLEGHPFAQYLAISAMQLRELPKLVQKIKEDTKKEILSETAEQKRKAAIKNNAPPGGGDNKQKETATLTPDQMSTAKSLFGNNPKLIARYARMIGKKDGTFTANV